MEIIKSNLKFKGQLTRRPYTNEIILHHTVGNYTGNPAEIVHKIHIIDKGWSGCGYHFLVDKDGKIYGGRPLFAQGAHCLHQNHHTIGIAAVGNYVIEEMPQAQEKGIIDICKYVMDRYNIKDIKKHSDYYPTSCPGYKFPFDKIKKELMQIDKTSKYNINFCVSFQNYYNTLTKVPLTIDGIYGIKTQAAYKSLGNIYKDYK